MSDVNSLYWYEEWKMKWQIGQQSYRLETKHTTGCVLGTNSTINGMIGPVTKH